MEARWKRCVEATDRALGDALGQKFVEVAFGGSSKTKALELVGQIKRRCPKTSRRQWMSPATKDQALTKLQEVSNKIGYPERWKDYSSAKIVRGDYFGDALRARQFEIRRNLRSSANRWINRMSMTPPTVNAY